MKRKELRGKGRPCSPQLPRIKTRFRACQQRAERSPVLRPRWHPAELLRLSSHKQQSRPLVSIRICSPTRSCLRVAESFSAHGSECSLLRPRANFSLQTPRIAGRGGIIVFPLVCMAAGMQAGSADTASARGFAWLLGWSGGRRPRSASPTATPMPLWPRSPSATAGLCPHSLLWRSSISTEGDGRIGNEKMLGRKGSGGSTVYLVVPKETSPITFRAFLKYCNFFSGEWVALRQTGTTEFWCLSHRGNNSSLRGKT